MAKSTADNTTAPLDPALPEKKRARRRLIGAVALLGIAAVAMSLVFDREPKQLQEELKVQLPTRDTNVVAPMVSPPSAGPSASGTVAPMKEAPGDLAKDKATATGSSKTEAPKTEAPKTEAPKTEAPKTEPAPPDLAKSDAKQTAVSSGKSEDNPKQKPAPAAPKPELKSAVKSVEKTGEKSAEKVSGKGSEKSAEKSPEKAPEKAATKGRYAVQLGAFSSEKGANELVAKVKATVGSGIGGKLYTEKVQTAAGERIRVRAGPFGDKDAAEQVRATLKAGGLESALIAP
jgi:DedD protein